MEEKVLIELPKCECDLCGECVYELFSSKSEETRRCFSCRVGLHASQGLKRPE